MTPSPRGGNFGVKSVKLMYFFSTPRHGLGKQSANNDQGRVYQDCKFHDLWDWGSCAWAGPYKSYSANALFL